MKSKQPERLRVDELPILENPVLPAFYTVVVIVIFWFFYEQVVWFEIIFDLFVVNASLMVESLVRQRCQCDIPKRNGGVNQSLYQQVQIPFVFWMQIIDVTRYPADGQQLYFKLSRKMTDFEFSPEISTSQGNHWNLVLNTFLSK